MPRLTQDQWQIIRAKREAGRISFDKLAAEFGVSKPAIVKRAAKEGWGDGSDVSETIRKKVTEKVAGVITDNPKMKQAAIDAEAERVAEVQRRHREEPNAIRERLYAGLKSHKAAETKEAKQLAFEDLKAAKIASECMANIHKMERVAYGLDLPAEDANQGAVRIVIEREHVSVP